MNSHVESLIQAEPLGSNQYFSALAGGGMSRSQFVETQRQFYHAVVYFSRPMGLLFSRMPGYGARWVLIKNASEEHGDGDPSLTHGSTFLEFLGELGTDPAEYPAPCVEVFNSALAGACSHSDWRICVAMLGIIEERFAVISGRIGRHVLDSGWLAPGQLRHYGVHEQLDTEHAGALYGLLAEEWKTEDGRRAVKRGLALGNRLFMDLYEGLWKAVA